MAVQVRPISDNLSIRKSHLSTHICWNLYVATSPPKAADEAALLYIRRLESPAGPACKKN